MKKEPVKRRKNRKNWERRAVVMMMVSVGALAAFCILLIISITVDCGNFAATLETLNQYADGKDVSEASPAKNTPSRQEEAPSQYAQDPEVIQLPVTSSTQAQPAVTTAETPQVLPAEQPVQQGIARYIFLGDSRYVAMSYFAQEQDYFIAKEGMGYSYMIEQLDAVRAAVIPGAVLVIGLGVNDVRVGNAASYIQTINELAGTLGIPVYYMLVNPVDETVESQNGYRITNAEVDAFNETLKAGLDAGVHIIDTNSFLKNDGYVTTDGLHYDMETYQKIYQYIKAQVLAS